MASFLGARVQLILNQPPNAEIQGTVHEIVAGQTLSLIDAYFPASGTRLPTFTVHSTAIIDIQVLPQPPKPIISVQQPRRVDTKFSTFEQESNKSPVSHVDPAILSYDRTRLSQPEKNAAPSPQIELPARPIAQEVPANVATVKRKQRQPKPRLQEHVVTPVIDVETSRHGNDMNDTTKRGKGWRQTPLLQPTQPPVKHKKSRKQRQDESDAQNGWATEDATDIQDMGEFDFEANHKLFDKQQVFDDLRKGDTTADEDRLVSHNKLAPRKNLLPTENVLSPKLDVEDKGSDADTEVDFHTGRSSSRHSMPRKQQSRTNSNLQEPRSHASSGSPSAEKLIRSATASRPGRPLPISTTSSIKATRNFSPHSATSTAASKRTNGTKISHTQAGLFISQSDIACPTLHSSALNMLEQEACSRYGLSVDAVTENAARAIAEGAITLIDSPVETRRGSRANTVRGGMTSSTHSFENVPPVIVVLAGTHSTGSRALAAARHLSARGYKIIIAEAPVQEQDEQYTRHTTIIKKMMRSGANIKRGIWPKANDYVRNLNGPPVVIVDALLAGTKYEDMQAIDQDGRSTTDDVHKMIDWANRSRAAVLSVTCPSGLSDQDGSATIVDGEPLAIKADKLIALGAPVTGVHEALKLGERFEITLADIGINIALKADDAVDFGTQWSVPLTFIATEQHTEA